MVPYDDPHYRRKNLSILSLIFIIYILAGGSIDNENGHTLPFLNITLDRPWVVVAIASIILIWFSIRYWQTEPAQGFDRADVASTLQHAGFKWTKTYSGGQIFSPESTGHQETYFELIPSPLEIETLRPWKLLKNLQAANPGLYARGTDTHYGCSADDAKNYSKPSLIRAAILGWRIRKEVLTELGVYYDWLIPWVLFILAALLTLIELVFAGLNGMLN